MTKSKQLGLVIVIPVYNEEQVVRKVINSWLNETKSIIPPTTKEYAERGGYYGYKPIYNADPLNELKINDFVKILQAEGVDIRTTVTPPLHRTELFSHAK